MAQLYPVAGAKIYIGAADDLPAGAASSSDFSGVTWTEIKGWTSMGPAGDTAAVVTTALIGDQRDFKQKGTRNAGQMQNVFAVINGDAGQTALIAAEASDSNYPFKILFDDAPSGGTGSQILFMGLVMSAQEAGGAANTVRTMNSTLEINTNIVRVAAAGA